MWNILCNCEFISCYFGFFMSQCDFISCNCETLYLTIWEYVWFQTISHSYLIISSNNFTLYFAWDFIMNLFLVILSLYLYVTLFPIIGTLFLIIVILSHNYCNFILYSEILYITTWLYVSWLPLFFSYKRQKTKLDYCSLRTL